MKKALLFICCIILAIHGYSQKSRVLATRIDQYTSGNWKSTDSMHFTYGGNRGGIDIESYSGGQFDTRLSYKQPATAWQNNTRITCTYDGTDRLLTQITEQFTNGNWVNYDKHEITYTGAGSYANNRSFTWDTTLNSWREYYLDSFTYDGLNRMVTHVLKNTNAGAYANEDMDSFYYVNNETRVAVDVYLQWVGFQWKPVFLRTNTYNPANKKIKDYWLSWKGVGLGWVDYEIDTSIYDGNNNLLSTTNLRLNGGVTWQTSNQWVYQYDADNNCTQSVSNVADSNGTTWKPYYRTIKTFDANGNALTAESASYTSGAWVNSGKSESMYNAGNEETQRINYGWTNNAWTLSSKFIYTFNIKGYRTNVTSYNYPSGNWVPTNSTTNWYEEIASVNEITKSILTKAFPNPCKDEFALTFNADKGGRADLFLYDIAGRLITRTETSVVEGGNQITWNAFVLPQGSYLYELHIPGAISRER